MKKQVSEVYRIGLGYSDYTPERLNMAINTYINNGWRVVSMVSIKGESRSSVIVVYERDAVDAGKNTNLIYLD